jgi:aryl-phospho-beta-D-glucosidase BglC (GH1 family)
MRLPLINNMPHSDGRHLAKIRQQRHLQRGINLSHWFAQTDQLNARHFAEFIVADDFRLLQSLGLDHVRFTINFAPFIPPQNPADLSADFFVQLDRAVALIHDAGLAVILDFHPDDDYKQALQDDPAAARNFVRFWSAYAARLAATDPERTYFEILNEPLFTDHGAWQQLQEQALLAIRAQAPAHTLIVSGAKWSGLYELLEMKKFPDDNLVYNFHFYHPMQLTHQGATWWHKAGAADLRNVSYPSSPESVLPLASQAVSEAARQLLLEYGAERWDAGAIDREFAKAAAWARQHDVTLTCNEFGVYKKFVARDGARARWLADVVAVSARYHIGWAMWDYCGDFALVEGPADKRELNLEVAKALGLLVKP